MFAAFAERYQIWAAGAHPLAGAAARKGGARRGGGSEEGWRIGKKKGERKGGRKLKVKAKRFKCYRTQLLFQIGGGQEKASARPWVLFFSYS